MRDVLLAASVLIAASGGGAVTPPAAVQRFPVPGPKPAPILQGVLVPAGSDILLLSGQVASPLDPAKPMSPDMTAADFGDTKTQTISCLTKIKDALQAHGFTMADVVKLTVFVVGDPTSGKMDFAGMNAGYGQFFGSASNPNKVARSAVQVAALAAPGLLVEIEATAVRARKP